MCTDPWWSNRETTGNCRVFPIRYGACISLPGTPFFKTISSFGPDEGMKCTVFDALGCQGRSFDIWYPGYADMRWNGWDDRIQSYRCAPDSLEISSAQG
ncbi:hypothetical protein K402DRAFT_43369 [Aulographum hederae CBS 113979]|uniref:Uncharacterized protein n=1 Tax=Aulographum hederae CBS 113979 TaxID=1176131 RepID=A0A6G1H3N4_9PEZI|nr:hypothetical protein K402DRAFT_43369 [Aulographum hederae CBS 113979]